MTDLLLSVKELLVEKTEARKVAIVSHVEKMPLEAGFPAIAVMDGGDYIKPGASEGLRIHRVVITIYSEIVGEDEVAVLEVRKIFETTIPLLENVENFHKGGAFEGYNGCSYEKSSESSPLEYVKREDKNSFIVIKLGRFEFTEVYQNAL